MLTLSQALDLRLRQAALVGWKLNRLRHINMQADGLHAILLLGWDDPSNTLRPAEGSPQRFKDHTVSVDLTDLPKGVSVLDWMAMPDTEDLIERPTLDDMRTAGKQLGCRYVDKLEGDGILTYCLVM